MHDRSSALFFQIWKLLNSSTISLILDWQRHLFLHNIVNIGYFVKWGYSEFTTFILHIYWALPVSIYGYFLVDDFYNFEFNNDNIYLIIFLFFYLFIFDFIYTSRNEYIDNPY